MQRTNPHDPAASCDLTPPLPRHHRSRHGSLSYPPKSPRPANPGFPHQGSRHQTHGTNANPPAAPAGALPTILFNSYRNLSDGTDTLKLTHYDPAHTDTDLSVHFTEADILHCGDTFWNGFYPFIDYSSGGNINGMIQATEQNLATAGPDTIVIPGHGPLGNKAQLTEFRDMLVGAHDNIAKLKKEGKSLDETIAAKPTAAFDAKLGKKPEAFIGYVYQGV